MHFIARPLDGYLQLIDSEGGEDTGEGVQGAPLTYGIPDEKFWAWLNASGWEATLEEENPERMTRVRKNGVGVLHNNKQALIDAGFATLAETVSKRPPENIGTGERPVLIATAAALEETIK